MRIVFAAIALAAFAGCHDDGSSSPSDQGRGQPAPTCEQQGLLVDPSACGGRNTLGCCKEDCFTPPSVTSLCAAPLGAEPPLEGAGGFDFLNGTWIACDATASPSAYKLYAERPDDAHASEPTTSGTYEPSEKSPTCTFFRVARSFETTFSRPLAGTKVGEKTIDRASADPPTLVLSGVTYVRAPR